MTDERHDDLIACQRLALAGSVSAMLAHEYNNLMTPILARSLDAIERDDVEVMRRTLDRTVAQVNKAIELSQHLLRLADPRDNSASAECSVARAVDEAIEEAVRPFKKDGIELNVSVPTDLKAKARSTLLEQVLLNLLVNARHAMKGARGSLRITAVRDGDTVVLDVTDSGVGIPQEEIDARFTPFLCADATADAHNWRRVGLGLHVCRTICQEHGATLEVRANAGAGCTFTLRWPAA